MNVRQVLAQFLFLIVVLLHVHCIIFITIIVFIARFVFKVNKVVIDGQEQYVFSESENQYFITNRIKPFKFDQKDGWLRIEPNPSNLEETLITIFASPARPYSWDGCSPKVQLLDLIFGTPDGAISTITGKPITYYASMVHDVLYQFNLEMEEYVNRSDVDKVFLDELKKQHFQLSFSYYNSVRMFGWIYWFFIFRPKGQRFKFKY